MSAPFVLSETGSGRATAYIESPKIITFQGKTHVAWLDSPPEGFRIKIRTLDQATGCWSEPVTVGEAVDNHGGPALTVDAAGYLHIVYYSHHHPFRYHRSARPNDASAWLPMEQFGADLTYPTLVCAQDGTLILTARRSHETEPWELELWRKPPDGAWTRQGAILKAQRLNYSQFAASMSWAPDHRGLVLTFRVYEQPSYDAPPVSYTWIGVMRSPDEGRTWQKLDDSPIRLPATYGATDVIFRTRSADGRRAEAGATALGPEGQIIIPYTEMLARDMQGYLAVPRADGGWEHRHLNAFLPPALRDHALQLTGGMAWMSDGRLIIIGQLIDLSDGGDYWAHPSTRLVRFESADGGKTFTAKLIGGGVSGEPQWLPNVERATGFNETSDHLGVLYTEGGAGGGLGDLLSNHVYWRLLD
ncbi:MAG: BNR-4 repeat-containing protein [Opitutaceae bacterium]|nr:BNR-4 repeat-containing protein [Opitutaceae bacterium]